MNADKHRYKTCYLSATKMSGAFLNAQGAAPSDNEGWRAGSLK